MRKKKIQKAAQSRETRRRSEIYRSSNNNDQNGGDVSKVCSACCIMYMQVPVVHNVDVPEPQGALCLLWSYHHFEGQRNLHVCTVHHQVLQCVREAVELPPSCAIIEQPQVILPRSSGGLVTDLKPDLCFRSCVNPKAFFLAQLEKHCAHAGGVETKKHR